jgi:hypothetical protein
VYLLPEVLFYLQQKMKDELPKIYFDSEKEPMESNIRMGCATVFGFCFAIYVIYRLYRRYHFSDHTFYVFLILAIVFICLFAYFAMRDGDSFWRKILKGSPWL